MRITSAMVAIVLLALSGSLFAEDYMRINVDTLYENQSAVWDFYLKRECPEPEFIYGANNAWRMYAVGNATWESAADYTPFSGHLDMFNLAGLLLTDFIGYPSGTEGWFNVGGAAMPPYGMPVIEEEMFWFSITVTLGDLPYGSTGDGIEIDSASWVGAA